MLEYKEEEIIIFGRSIGTGIATALASFKKLDNLLKLVKFILPIILITELLENALLILLILL